MGVQMISDCCDPVITNMMRAINLGSRGLDEARNFVAYVNGQSARTAAIYERRMDAPNLSIAALLLPPDPLEGLKIEIVKLWEG